ncbi:MAG: hypothetical protein JO166_22940 [Deltaproteobacteria bacterium]|nr:hypothetical protein [Deltaproteobacteria bacterium]
MLSPSRVGGFVTHLPSFIRVFYRLMTDRRVSPLAKLVPLLGVLLLLTPPALELDFIPLVGELDWVLVIFISLKVFIWLCPPEVVREHVSRIAHRV